jgi:hypothetical protein
MMETKTEVTTSVNQPPTELEGVVIRELAEDGYDLPELADTMEEADARAAASTYLFAMRNVQRDLDANDAEFAVLQDFNRTRHEGRQRGPIRQILYLRGVVEGLFGFMTTGKKKSLNLIGGRVGMRSQTDELVVEDDDAVIAWARHYEEKSIVRITEGINRKELRVFMELYDAALEPEAGDVPPPPGVKLEQRDDVFYATPAKD